ncbi:putative quinol monooxygenase [Salinisphaera sp.]|uniref:putative quinol monooxygenase n=1 Tax=Salinisphaera sp. TaxID=1914330 RepID=UPI002D78CCC3|nr:putative quinol monooxygenase [Salinisphaera sp.]HET7314595.1 putative quinol monooxygenase [Salinisphaera sp.]
MSAQPGFIVIAEFALKPGQRQAFLEHAHEDARQSLANEDDCHQFDVLVPDDADNVVVLHEAYTDRAAFDTHTRMPHYQPFKDDTAPLLASEPVVRFFFTA